MFLRNRKAEWMILCFNQYKKMLKLFFVCFLEWLHYERMSEKSFKNQVFLWDSAMQRLKVYSVFEYTLRNVYTQHSNIIHARNELVLNLKHSSNRNVKETVTNSSVFVYSIVLCSKTWAHLAQVRRCWSVCRPVESRVPSCQIHSMPSFRAQAALIATQG